VLRIEEDPLAELTGRLVIPFFLLSASHLRANDRALERGGSRRRSGSSGAAIELGIALLPGQARSLGGPADPDLLLGRKRCEEKSLAAHLEAELNAQVVGRIGHIFILYREQSDPEKRRIDLPD
jgi:hypothetical protein